MSRDKNVHGVVHRDDDSVNGKAESDSVQDGSNNDFILSGDLSGQRKSESLENDEKYEESEKDDMTVDVGETVTQLEELDRLLGELNFRELIIQFGRVQGDMELIRYELDIVKKESIRVREAIFQADHLGIQSNSVPAEIIRGLRERIYSLADGIRKVISQQEILRNYATSSRGWLLDRSGEAVAALEQIREAQRSRMEMVVSLNQMLESDAPNEKLASAALEFAVLMRELDRDEGLERLDEVISEIGGFRAEVEQAETMVLGDTPQLEDIKNNLGMIEEIPNMTGELFSFLSTVGRTLDKIAAGWNDPESTEHSDQEDTLPAESDE